MSPNLRVLLDGWILEKMEKRGETIGEEIFFGVFGWVNFKEEKLVRPGRFLPRPTKMLYQENREKSSCSQITELPLLSCFGCFLLSFSLFFPRRNTHALLPFLVFCFLVWFFFLSFSFLFLFGLFFCFLVWFFFLSFSFLFLFGFNWTCLFFFFFFF